LKGFTRSSASRGFKVLRGLGSDQINLINVALQHYLDTVAPAERVIMDSGNPVTQAEVNALTNRVRFFDDVRSCENFLDWEEDEEDEDER
jgi:hypothetical protein